MMQGLKKLPDEIARMTPAQLVAISRASKADGQGVRIGSPEEYAAWVRRMRQQQRPEDALKRARKIMEARGYGSYI